MPDMRRSRGSTGAAKPASRRKSESQKSGLTPSLMTALQRDVYEDEAIATRNRRALDQDEESDSVEGEKLDGTDEEITSDEDDNVLDKPATRQREDDSISFGSSVEADDVMDISHMLSDGESESLDGEGGPTMCSHDDEANSGMLQAIGLRANRSLRARERTEGVEESELSLPHAAQVSIQELLGPLGEGVMVEQLRRDLQNVSKAGARRSVHAQLAAPIEQAAKRRLERQAAAEEAHREVSGWEQAVHQQATAETLSFPQGRQDVHGTTLGSITSSGAKNALENDVDKLLEEHMMDERAAAEAELDALRDRDRNSRLTPAEVAERMAEMKKMRELLFYHEVKAKRIAKIKSRAYRKVHKKASQSRDEQREQLGQLDQQTAMRLQMKREIDRVRERMTLKHKNTSRWARHALKQQKHNPALAQAVQEQLTRGEELRRKQMDAGAGGGNDEDDFDGDDSDSSGEGNSGRGDNPCDELLWKLQNEPEPELPQRGVFGMAFMRRAAERQKREAEEMLAELASESAKALRNQPETNPSDDYSSADEAFVGKGEGDASKPQEQQLDKLNSTVVRGKRKIGQVASHPKAIEGEVGRMKVCGSVEALPIPSYGKLRASQAVAPATIVEQVPTFTVDAECAARPAVSTSTLGENAEATTSRDTPSAYITGATPSSVTSGGIPIMGKAPLVAPSSNGATGLTGSLHKPTSAFKKPKSRPKTRFDTSLVAPMENKMDADACKSLVDLTTGASLLIPTASQQSLVEEAFPESVEISEFASEKQALVEAEAGVAEETEMPGWGDWSGLGVKPNRRQEQRKRTAKEARQEQLEKAADRRKDAALRNVIISEKRDKKAAKFTVAAVPFPFKSREQFERSMRNPLGVEWNTTESHAQMIQPRIATIRGAVIDPIEEKRRVVTGKGLRRRRA